MPYEVTFVEEIGKKGHIYIYQFEDIFGKDNPFPDHVTSKDWVKDYTHSIGKVLIADIKTLKLGDIKEIFVKSGCYADFEPWDYVCHFAKDDEGIWHYHAFLKAEAKWIDADSKKELSIKGEP